MSHKYIDLHMHTRYSDGELTPINLVQCMAARGMDIIAISDHDNYRAYFEAKNTADKYGLILIPASEITTPNYHLLALGFNPENKEFQKFLDYASRLQERNTVKKIKILQEYGVPISMEKMKMEFGNARLGKGNILTLMVSDKECKEYILKHHKEFTRKQLMDFYLGKEGMAKDSLKKEAVSPKEAIDAVHKAGGIIGIAHAPKDVINPRELEVLRDLGIDFLEIQPNARILNPKGKVTYETVEKFARENNLPLTYGSDYHGPNIPRPFLERGENILSESLRIKLNNCAGIKEKL